MTGKVRAGNMRRQAWAIYNEAPETLIPRLLDEKHSVYGIAKLLGVNTNSVRVFAENIGYAFDSERAIWVRTGGEAQYA